MANGIWNGTPILDDPAYFTAMTNSSQSINTSYGYLTWLNGKTNFMVPGLQFSFNGSIVPDAPADMYAALGKNGQIINVVPSQNIVMIRMGDGDGVSLVGTQYNDSIWIRMNDLNCTQSIDETSIEANISISPNPNTGNFILNGLEETDVISVRNSLGQTIDFLKTKNTLSIYQAGIYFVEITRNEIRTIRKVIID
jgi:hypothetical protein